MTGLTPNQTLEESTQDTFESETAPTVGGRIKLARVRAGLKTDQLAELVGSTQATVSKWENDVHNVKQSMIVKIATALSVDLVWLMTGENDDTASEGLPIVGYAGSGAVVYPIDDHALGGGLDFIDPPFGVPDDCVGVINSGESNYPDIEDGDVLIYRRDAPFVLHECINKRCIVETEDGRVLIKRLKMGTEPGTFDLLSTNAETMKNVRIIWAAKILGTVHR